MNKKKEAGKEFCLSVVVPIYNEEENIPILYGEIIDAVGDKYKKLEIIFINDGSKDDSFSKLKELHEKDPRVKVINFRKNFGQSPAISAGFDYCNGDYVVAMDGDLQNDPADIPMIVEHLQDGYDIVNGWRKNRQDKLVTKKIPSFFGNKLISFMTGVKLHDYGCTLRGFTREVVKSLKLYGEMHRYIPALASKIGIESIEVPVNHRARRFGKSQYGLGRTFRVILDLISIKYLLSYSHRPLQIFGGIGMGMMSLGFLSGLYITFTKYFMNQSADRPLLFLTVLLIFLGFQVITLGLLAEMLSRIYHEGLNKSVYSIREEIGFEDENINDRA